MNYKQSPLPFQGQKRNFITHFAAEIADLPANTVFVDLFGGSGLLSRTAKDTKPQSRVIYNDYDDFRQRIEAIPTTNKILAELRVLFANMPKEKKVPADTKAAALAMIERYERQTFVDYVTLSSSVLFSPNYVVNFDQLNKERAFYNCVRKSEISPANDYLDGLEIRKAHYKDLYNEFAGNENVFFILDPPYLSTEIESYSMYWRLRDYLDVLDCLKGNKYAYFTSEKSALLELFDCLEQRHQLQNPFAGAKRIETNNGVNGLKAGYKDIMMIRTA